MYSPNPRDDEIKLNIDWKISNELVAYPEALEFMENRVGQIIKGNEPETVWLLEHPPIYTAGTSAKEGGLLDSSRFPVYYTGRGGEFTYHGPGQRIAYIMLDLKSRMKEPDLRKYVNFLEQLIIDTLGSFDISGARREGRIGIWTEDKNGKEEKIAALGVRVKKWVTFHGISVNINPNLEHFTGIVPCGIKNYGVTSTEKLGKKISMDDFDREFKKSFEKTYK